MQEEKHTATKPLKRMILYPVRSHTNKPKTSIKTGQDHGPWQMVKDDRMYECNENVEKNYNC
jgi:hypothetical protein